MIPAHSNFSSRSLFQGRADEPAGFHAARRHGAPHREGFCAWPDGRQGRNPAWDRVFVVCVLVIFALLLSGCSKQLLGSLDEMAANQVVSVLRLEGIHADKAAVGDKAWKVSVDDDQFAEAVQLMERHNLPPPPFQGLGQVFKKESLVSTPTEERARLIHAMSQELERSLMSIDGVLVARVHPVILPHDPLNPKRLAATASVLIKYRAGVDTHGREGMVRSLVAAGIEGLSYDDVRVVMVPAEPPVTATALDKPLANGPVTGPAAALSRFTSQHLSPLYGGMVALLLAALVLSYVWARWKRPVGTVRRGLPGRWADTVSSVFGEGVPEAGKRQIPKRPGESAS